MVAGGEELPVGHLKVAFLGADDKDLPFSTLLLCIGVVCTIEVGLGSHVLGEREW